MDLTTLLPEFREKLESTLESVKARGFEPLIFHARLSYKEQAQLWNRSRTWEEIERTAEKMVNLQAPRIAELISKKTSEGKQETLQLPGQSWLQHGEAACVKFLTGDKRSIWTSGYRGYEVLAEEAAKTGLVSGYLWKLQDPYWLQFRKDTVRSYMTWEQIDQLSLREL